MTNKLLDRHSFLISLAVFASFWAVVLFDQFDREERGGMLVTFFLLMYVPAIAGFAFLRFVWGIFCERVLKLRDEGKEIQWSLCCLDAVPWLCVLAVFIYFDFSYIKFLPLPLIVIFLEQTTLSRPYGEKFWKNLLATAVEALSYLVCGLAFFTGMNFSENLAYIFVHYQFFLFPAFFLRNLRAKRLSGLTGTVITAFLPLLVAASLKGLYGRISQLDMVFFAAVMAISITRIAIENLKSLPK